MAKLGSHKRPAVVRVKSEELAGKIMEECEANGWQVIVGIEPDKSENISDLKKLRNKGFTPITTKERCRPISGNTFCPCGSGKKYKKCCQLIDEE